MRMSRFVPLSKLSGVFFGRKKKKKNMCDFLLFDRFYCDSVLGKIMITIY